MSSIKAIVFDWDGVLVDSLWVLEDIYRRMGPHFGVHEFVQGKDWFECDWKKHWSMLLGGDERLPEVKQKYLELIHLYDDRLQMFPGATEMITDLGQRTTLAILTNNHRERIIPILERYGIHNAFKFIYDAHEPYTKPDPHVITLTAQRLGVKPSEIAFTGDMDAELEMAKLAGCGKVFASSYGYHSVKRLLPVNPDYIADSPAALHRALLEVLHG